MNSNLKKNINTAGTVGYIISIFMIIAVIAGMVAVALGTVAAGLVAREEVNVTVSSNIDVNANGDILDKLRNVVTLDDGENFVDLVGESDGTSVAVNDNDLSEFSVTETENGMAINAKTNPVEFSAKMLIAALVTTFVFLGCVCVMFHMVKYLMKSLRDCDTPFTEAVIKNMERFGWSLIPVIVLSAITEAMWGGVATGGNMFNISINLGGLLVLAVVFVLTLVFKYGAELQKESDEIL